MYVHLDFLFGCHHNWLWNASVLWNELPLTPKRIRSSTA